MALTLQVLTCSVRALVVSLGGAQVMNKLQILHCVRKLAVAWEQVRLRRCGATLCAVRACVHAAISLVEMSERVVLLCEATARGS